MNSITKFIFDLASGDKESIALARNPTDYELAQHWAIQFGKMKAIIEVTALTEPETEICLDNPSKVASNILQAALFDCDFEEVRECLNNLPKKK